MGKLQYKTRKSTGVKLGQTVVKDIQKYKPSQTAKRIVSKDPHVEINISGKVLGDEGFKLVCSALTEALAGGYLKLDELNVSENAISLAGLQALVPVVRAAARDLKDLDLRGNALSVSSEKEKASWEQWLESFAEVCNLRRLDISDNPIGEDGWEILWRVYVREPPLRLARPRNEEGESSGDSSDFDESGSDLDELTASARQVASGDSPSTSYSEKSKGASSRCAGGLQTDRVGSTYDRSRDSSRSPILSRTGPLELHGLRSIPYLVLTTATISDRTALALSYVIAQHKLPERLLERFAAPISHHWQEQYYKYELTGCCGVIYKGVDAVTDSQQYIYASRLLKAAEAMRGPRTQFTMKFPEAPIKGGGRRHSEHNQGAIRADGSVWIPGHKTDNKRNSAAVSIGTTLSATDLERMTSKVQNSILTDTGINSVELWKTVLQVLVLARALCFDPSAPYTGSSRPSPRGKGGVSHPVTPVKDTHDQSSGLPMSRQTSNGTKPERAGVKKLPESVWKKIVVLRADPKGLLSPVQVDSVIAWARSRDTLETERESLGKLSSAQIWRVLNAVDGLAYSD